MIFVCTQRGLTYRGDPGVSSFVLSYECISDGILANMIQWNVWKYLARKKVSGMFDDDMPNPACQTAIRVEVHHCKSLIRFSPGRYLLFRS